MKEDILSQLIKQKIWLHFAIGIASLQVGSVSYAGETPLTITKDGRLPPDLKPFLTVVKPQDESARATNMQFLPTGIKPPLSIYGNEVLWLNLDLINHESTSIKVVLASWMMLPHSIYLVQHQDENRVYYRGFADKKAQRADLSFFTHQEIEVQPGLTRIFWGIKSPWYPVPLSIELKKLTDFQDSLETRTMLLNLHMGSIVTFMVILLLAFVFGRDRIMGFYLLVVTAFITIQSGLTGIYLIKSRFVPFLGQYVWPALFVLTKVVTIVLIMEYFKQRKILNRKIKIKLYSIAILQVFLLPLGYFDAVAFSLAFLAGIVLLMIFIIEFLIIKKRDLHTYLFLGAFTPILAVTIFMVFAFNGLIEVHMQVIEIIFYLSASINCVVTLFLLNISSTLDKKARDILEVNLKSIFNAEKVNKILKNGVVLDTKPALREVTILFVDIVGYSKLLAQQPPQHTFESLKYLLGTLTSIIHKYEGVVDRTLGDGCLAFFGYDLAGGSYSGHETIATQCAMEIQRTMVENIRGQSFKQGLVSISRLRIGIHTSSVCIGNIGDDTRYDYTMSGYGVVLASRLENSCEPFKIHISEDTHKNLDKEFLQNNRLYPKLISIKHHQSLVHCFEMNPFDGEPEKLAEANKIFNMTTDVKRILDRYESNSGFLGFETTYGRMKLINFGLDGYCLSSKTYLGHNILFQLDITSIIPVTNNRLPRTVIVEVLWSAPKDKENFLHGVKIVWLSTAEKMEILSRINHLLDADLLPNLSIGKV